MSANMLHTSPAEPSLKVRAAVLEAPGAGLVLDELELEAPRENEVRVRVIATGICHTDILMLDRPFPVAQPIVLGHEGAGVVEAIGLSVTKVKPGDRVVLSFNFCGRCRSCMSRAPSYCQYFFGSNFLGQRTDGTTALSRGGQPVRHNFFGQSSFATHCVCTEHNVVKVPESVPDELFPLLGPLGCGIQTGAGAIVNVLRPGFGQSVAVFGAGAVGLAAVMAARAHGAGVIVAVDKHDARLDLALQLGATHTVNTDRTPAAADQIRAITDGLGIDISLDTTAVIGILHQAIEVLGPLGRCGFVGGAPVGASLGVDVRDMMLQGKMLRGIVEGDSNADLFIPELIRMQAFGRFPFEKLIRTYPLDQIQVAISDAKSGATVKPVLLMPG
jgi:aryl-alcohol dehydrogenase